MAGNPYLSMRARVIENIDHPDVIANIGRLGADMMRTANHLGLQGLAAPQVLSGIRMFIISVHKTPTRPQITEPYSAIVVNPKIIIPQVHEEVMDWEGCASIPGVYAKVPRPRTINVEYYSYIPDSGRIHFVQGELSDFNARVFAHEYDHLNGVLFLSRVTPEGWSTLCAGDEYTHYLERDKALREPRVQVV